MVTEPVSIIELVTNGEFCKTAMYIHIYSTSHVVPTATEPVTTESSTELNITNRELILLLISITLWTRVFSYRIRNLVHQLP